MIKTTPRTEEQSTLDGSKNYEIHEDESEYFTWLNELRASGVCNMFEAPQRLQDEFGMPKQIAMQIFKEWAANFKG